MDSYNALETETDRSFWLLDTSEKRCTADTKTRLCRFLLFYIPLSLTDASMYVYCSWHQIHSSMFGKETGHSTKMRWQILHHQGTRPCCPLPGTWTVSPMARTGRMFTRQIHRISMVCPHGWFLFGELSSSLSIYVSMLDISLIHLVIRLFYCCADSDLMGRFVEQVKMPSSGFTLVPVLHV